MIDLCLFDFDNTLLKTDDLWDIRLKGKDKLRNGKAEAEYAEELRRRIGDLQRRLIFTEEELFSLRKRFPSTRFGLFTRAPAAYIWVVDNMAYPSFFWDTAICYESIDNGLFKPHGYGIQAAMNELNVKDSYKVVMVGDDAADIRSAYNAGCYAVLDKRSWPRMLDQNKHWRAIELIPDGVIDSADDLSDFLANPQYHAPILEYHTTDGCLNDERLFDRGMRYEPIMHFFPPEVGQPQKSYEIICAARHFSAYRSLDARRHWHTLTDEIHRYKTGTEFPDYWCTTVYSFVTRSFPTLAQEWRDPVTITAIPSREGREPRLQHFVNQCQTYWVNLSSFRPDALQANNNLLFYDKGARSHSGERLSREERFANVRDHLHVRHPTEVAGKDIIVIDDVVTTGASLMYAKAKLQDAGARSVHLLALAKNVSDVLRS
ncbi:HAD family hydrolase [Paraburkholderia caribensis]|uniref:HAD family hydrolase n=1 Tax=Paraburkholderia caribensis TaxID=75105 RepID=A0A9Q6RZX5_9BURK|nr:HAD family hydrolase [Paraburkholderia caribensis]MCO4875569.1 HAD hydrolase-like protein [Paraburkholderia caribensis]PTB30512.1 hypothetical protein C9I56_01830 [Paraburkholderia caribensis]QLB62247.1 hypothetical protein A9O66_07555 [Paraburkholderia caribensis]